MNDSYAKLASELDRIPNGFPRTESGVELKLLAKLFSPEDASLASTLSMEPRSLAEIAAMNGQNEAETKTRLIGMVERGLIDIRREEGRGFLFHLISFVVGFYERQNAKIDKELIWIFSCQFDRIIHSQCIKFIFNCCTNIGYVTKSLYIVSFHFFALNILILPITICY